MVVAIAAAANLPAGVDHDLSAVAHLVVPVLGQEDGLWEIGGNKIDVAPDEAPVSVLLRVQFVTRLMQRALDLVDFFRARG
jgi:hypothetical protein